MRLHLIRGAAALAAWSLALTLAARAEPPKESADAVPLPVTGKANPDLAPFDDLMTGFLRKQHLPGAAVAVARNGRLIYSRGFGCSDRDNKEPVEPDALFRIASISKPITAVAVLQLVERGKLHLDDKVFDVLGLKAPNDPGTKFDERWEKVTILHLLQHRGGWDRDKSFDPMFRSPAICKELKVKPPADPDAIVRYMLRRPLDFDPGERYAYSNFGYCLLGRVIEKVAECGYEDYVKKEVLAPLGIERMRLGKTLPEGRAPGEVKYYSSGMGPAVMGPDLGEPVPWPYGAYCLESMDSHGAWIASAEDLVRFAAAFNQPDHCKILSAKSIETMFARPPGAAGEDQDGKPAAVYYACGWSVRPVRDGKLNTWHNGSLDGTSTLLVRRWDNLTWAVLFNARETESKQEPSGLIDPLMHRAAAAVKHWPGDDLAAAGGDTVADQVRQSLTVLRQGDADKALELAEKAVAAGPKDPDALFARAAARAALHQSADAVADFDKVVELDPKRAEAYDRRGSEEFKLGRFKEAVADFDRFLEIQPEEAPGHWRRGIALYYAGRYDAGRKQFASYEKVDTNDVENAVWHFLCAARTDGVDKARASMLKIGKDVRVPMMKVYDLFHGDARPEDVTAAAQAGDATDDERKQRLFFAHLYLGLYFDATGDKKQALEHMTQAAHKYYLDNYMGDVARVHEEVLLKEKETGPK